MAATLVESLGPASSGFRDLLGSLDRFVVESVVARRPSIARGLRITTTFIGTGADIEVLRQRFGFPAGVTRRDVKLLD